MAAEAYSCACCDFQGAEMKLLRYLDGETPCLGAAKDGGIVALARLVPRYRTMREIAGLKPEELAELAQAIAGQTPDFLLEGARLLAPIERPGKYLGAGVNYGKHAEEASRLGMSRSQYQTWFNKQTTCLSGPFDLIDPGVTEQLDYEVELGVVIGQPAKLCSEANAPQHVFGYFIANDVSARDWQRHSSTVTMGKSFDSFGPIGPWIVTADEISDPHQLGLRCYVNGEIRQNGNTADMIHNIWQQIAYLSTAFTLETGDLLATGTPEGVGVGMDPPCFLKEGDVVRCEIDGIGAIENRVACQAKGTTDHSQAVELDAMVYSTHR
jgi:2-keto-4-pentenoate hydratase/2-oxohepta-3-ene-1,7-dioic acid hydratase in catechol pathway